MQLSPEQVAECHTVALRRKQASLNRSKRNGESTIDQESRSVMAEYAFALALGYTEDEASESISKLQPTPGYQFEVGDNTIKIYSTGPTSRKIIVKADRTDADFYVLARVTESGEVDLAGWAGRDYLVSNEPIDGKWGLNYELFASDLNPLSSLFHTLCISM